MTSWENEEIWQAVVDGTPIYSPARMRRVREVSGSEMWLTWQLQIIEVLTVMNTLTCLGSAVWPQALAIVRTRKEYCHKTLVG